MDTSYVVHAGIRPDTPINRQYKDHCIYIRIWNRRTKRISNEVADPWWYQFAYLYDSRKHHSPPLIKIFFGHQRYEKALVSHWVYALDGGVVFGGRFQRYVENKGIVEINANIN